MFSYTYFQKSLAYLYPALGFQKIGFSQPVGSYLGIEGFTFEHTKPLILLYSKGDPYFEKTLTALKEDSNFEFSFDLDSDFHLVIFDMAVLGSDYDRIIKGHYSQVSQNLKTIIVNSKHSNLLVAASLEPDLNREQVELDLGLTVGALKDSEIAEKPRMNTSGEILFVNDLSPLKQFYFPESKA